MWGEQWEQKSEHERAGIVMWTSFIMSGVLTATLLLINYWQQNITVLNVILPPVPLLLLGYSFWLLRAEQVEAAGRFRSIAAGAAFIVLTLMLGT